MCFQVAKLLAAPPWFGSLLLGILGFPVAVMVYPLAAVGLGAFERSLTSAELNPMEE